jgi:hypothetical protein
MFGGDLPLEIAAASAALSADYLPGRCHRSSCGIASVSAEGGSSTALLRFTAIGVVVPARR